MAKMSSTILPLPPVDEIEPWDSFKINDFDGGLILDIPETSIANNQFTRLLNYYIDEDRGFLKTRGPFQPYFVNTSESILATAPETFKFVNINGTEILVASREAGSDMAIEFWETGGTDEWVSILSSNLTTANQVNFAVFRINDAQDLIIANGKDVPLRWNDTATTGDDPATIDTAATNLGLTAPSIGTPAVTDTATANKRGLQFNGNYFYKFTAFFDSGGTNTKFGESGPSAASSGLTAAGADISADTTVSMALESLPAVASGTTKNNIYRSPPDQSAGPFRFIGSYSSGTTFTDETPVGEEGAETPADAGAPPRLKFPVVANGRLWGIGLNASGGLNYKLVFSEDGEPDMFLAINFFYLPDEIKGIKEFNRDLYIFTEKQIFFLKEADPSNALLKISDRGCTSHNSIVDVGDGLVWQAKDGIFWADFNIRAIDGDYPIPIAEGLSSEFRSIAASQRANSVAILYRERYYISYTSTSSANNKTLCWHINKLPFIISGKLKTAGWTEMDWGVNYFDVFAPNSLAEHLYTADDANLYIQEHDVFGTVDYLNFTDFGAGTSQDIVTAITSRRLFMQDLASNTIYSSIALATKTTNATFTASLNLQRADGTSFDKAKTIVAATGTLATGTALYGSAVYGTDVYGANVKALRQNHARWPIGSKGRNAQLSLTSNAGNDTDVLLITLKHREEPITY